MVQRENGRAGRRETFARFSHVAASVSINHGGKTRHAFHDDEKPMEAVFGAIEQAAQANTAC